ncbi:MAG: hypothetical protein AABY18_05125 [Candidatus Thermoplasmatota archaeon]
MEDRGLLLFEYDPPRAHPILYAGLLVFGFVFLTGSVENLLRDNRPELFAVYALPVIATALILVALLPSSVRIHAHGIAPARPLALRWWRPFLAWSDVAACYPSSYDVTGAFVSPFASSDGKVTQTGIGLELRDGHVETVQFTPSRFSLTSRRSRGFREAWPVVEGVFAGLGRPLVPAAPTYTQSERAAMLAEARKPFLPFFAIVFLFASAAPVVWALLYFGVPVRIALPLGLLAPLGTSVRSWTASRRRNRILDALSKAAEFERERASRESREGRENGHASAAFAQFAARPGGQA